MEAVRRHMQEFCNGGSLRSVLQRGGYNKGGMLDRWLSVQHTLRGLAEGMMYTHSKRVCHGDLNPSNILLRVRPSRVPRACDSAAALPRHCLLASCDGSVGLVNPDEGTQLL